MPRAPAGRRAERRRIESGVPASTSPANVAQLERVAAELGIGYTGAVRRTETRRDLGDRGRSVVHRGHGFSVEAKPHVVTSEPEYFWDRRDLAGDPARQTGVKGRPTKCSRPTGWWALRRRTSKRCVASASQTAPAPPTRDESGTERRVPMSALRHSHARSGLRSANSMAEPLSTALTTRAARVSLASCPMASVRGDRAATYYLVGARTAAGLRCAPDRALARGTRRRRPDRPCPRADRNGFAHRC